MMTKNDSYNRNQMQIMSVDDLVPSNHVLREIDKALDFSFIYDLVKDLYCLDNGRPSIDPVVLFKIALIQFLFGIRSMRQTIKEIEVNMAYRWFLGFGMADEVPHFTTFGKNYVRRFADSDVFEKIFEHILLEAVRCGFVDAAAVFIDATHIKASANKKKSRNEEVKVAAKHYHAELMQEINKDREANGKKPLKDRHNDDENHNGGVSGSGDGGSSVSIKTKNIKVSKTDPESGVFHKGEHQKMFAYTAHIASDKHGFILGCDVAAANVHDSTMFDELFKDVLERFPEIKTAALDSAYKTPWIMKQIFDSKRLAATPYKRPMTKKGFFRKHEYTYDEYYNCYLCPQNQILKYSTTNRDGYREYKSDPKICINCPSRHKCTQSKNHTKVITRHIWQDYMELAEDVRHSPEGKAAYSLRNQTIERVFADAKEKHFMRYTHYRGLAKLKMQTLLTFTAMNLKKMARWKKKNEPLSDFSIFPPIFNIFHKNSPPYGLPYGGLSAV
jgi:transposase